MINPFDAMNQIAEQQQRYYTEMMRRQMGAQQSIYGNNLQQAMQQGAGFATDPQPDTKLLLLEDV